MQVAETRVLPERQHRVFWWKEALIVAVFYLVYSWTRNQFGSNAVARGGLPSTGLPQRRAGDPLRADRRAVPRGDAAGAVPAVPRLHPVLEHVLRHRPLRRHARRVRPAVLEAPGRVPGVAQQPGDHDGAGDRRLRPVPADAAAPARRAVPGVRRGLHRERPAARRRRRSGSSTRWRSTAGRGRSTPRRWPTSPTSTRRCRACTSGGRRGAPWRCGRCCAGAGSASPCFLYPLATLFCIIVTGNHFWIDGVGGLLAFAVGTLIGWGLHRWNQNRLDRKHARDGRRRRRRRPDDRIDATR